MLEWHKEDPKTKDVASLQAAPEGEVVITLSNTEAHEFLDFDLTIEPEGTWDPPGAMTTFLDKHFNYCLLNMEREAILCNFPKPNCSGSQTGWLGEGPVTEKGVRVHNSVQRELPI